ncbi:MAG: hypothetical protein KGH60_02285 [Candidatus Micrarchaeota archaeon]|nr:hypothetical protein [Candidatus Micrarchaeota archaeon]
MDFYDIVMPSCEFDDKFAKRLGLKGIFKCGADIKLANADKQSSFPEGRFIAVGSNKNNLIAAARAGAAAVVVSDSRIDRKLMMELKEQKTALILPTTLITSSYNLERPKRLYMMGRLYSHAKRLGLDIGFATMAESKANMCSYMQVIQLARLVGADESQARHGVSAVNPSIVD